MLSEYKNPQDSEKISTFADELEKIYDEKIKMGCSRHEITLEYLKEVIGQLRRLEKMFKV